MQFEEFIKNAHYFSLGHLPTEGFHPLTHNLSDLVLQGDKTGLAQAIKLTQQIDLEAIHKIKSEFTALEAMERDINAAFARGNRVFLSGCGATGRLALALESTYRKVNQGNAHENSVQALMAGGDFALVKSVENFEDFPEYGCRHLHDLGFREGDLLIAITEGGETPYVIGTLHGALRTSAVNHWFVYCNPKELLRSTVERSREVIDHPRVNSLCIDIGPMALSGSTRLQAATVQMLSVGAALLGRLDLVDRFIHEYQKLHLAPFLVPAIEWESQAYLNQGVVLYQTSSYPIAVLTDTTERSPTFSLTPFEKSDQVGGPYSLCYLSIPNANTAHESWERILHRSPLGLEWPELNDRLGLNSILEFDFGIDATHHRKERVSPKQQNIIQLDRIEGSSKSAPELEFKTEDFDSRLCTSLLEHPLTEQILVKVLLNTLSLMVMGRLKRYEGNVMTWVRPSNGKLIDRTLRYLEYLIQKRGLKPVAREKLTRMIFDTFPTLSTDDAIILKLLERI